MIIHETPTQAHLDLAENDFRGVLPTELGQLASLERGFDVEPKEGTPTSLDEPAGKAREDYAACCCAVQNLCLSLHADGLGTKWTTGAVNFDPRFGEAAGLPPNEYVVGTIWFGTASKPPKPVPRRLSVAEVLRRHD